MRRKSWKYDISLLPTLSPTSLGHRHLLHRCDTSALWRHIDPIQYNTSGDPATHALSAMRKGSAEAKVLFDAEPDEGLFLRYLQAYDRCISKVAESKKKPELVALNKFWLTELPVCDHLTLQQLSNVCKFKLTRGKMRPLQKLVDSNDAEKVRASSHRAIALLRQSTPDWEGALNALAELKGVGVATASCVTAAIRPDLAPFMSDEALEAATPGGERDYSMKSYSLLRMSLVRKASALGRLNPAACWTAEDVGRALWSCAMCSAHGVDVNGAGEGDLKELFKKTERKRKKTASDTNSDDCSPRNKY